MKKHSYLTWKIFFMILVSFMIIFSYSLYQDVKEWQNQTIDFYSSTMNNCDQILEDYSKNRYGLENIDSEELYMRIAHNSVQSVNTYYTVLDTKCKELYTLPSEYDRENVLVCEGMSTYYIELDELSKTEIHKLKAAVKKSDETNIIFSAEESDCISHEFFSDGKWETNGLKTIVIKPKYIAVEDEVIFGQKQKEISSGKFRSFNDKNTYITFLNGQFIEKNIKKMKKEQHAFISEIQDLLVEVQGVRMSSANSKQESYSYTKSLQKWIDEDGFVYRTFNYYIKGNTIYFYQIQQFYKEGTTELAPQLDGMLVTFVVKENFISNSIIESIQQNKIIYMIFLVLMIIMSYFISTMTTKRIKKIDAVACQIADNHFDIKLDEKGYDELSSLSRHINTMSANLKHNINQLNEEIEHVKKMENMRKEFIAHFTHEIKTPLAIMNGNLELIQGTQDEQKQNKYIEVINKEIAIINHLVLQMLDLSKLEAHAVHLNKEELCLEDLVIDVIDYHENLFLDKNLKVDFQSVDETMIQADRNRISMVIQNFLSNAIRHSDNDSTIQIQITERYFSIENKGKPISEEMIEKIWQSFVSYNQEGTGLGLAICKNILELHGFAYGVQNTNSGVKFYFQYKNML